MFTFFKNFDSILVSTGSNRNDDWFEPSELWAARASLTNVPINIGHDGVKIVGHVTAVRPVSWDTLVPLDEGQPFPAQYHLKTAGVLYLSWEDGERQTEVDQLVADIDAGKVSVSMEVLFANWDYVVTDDGGKATAVARTDSTRYLTKNLRVYGGSGRAVYQGREQAVGRLLRNMVFVGQGMVQTPANPHSKIVAEPAKAVATVKVAAPSLQEQLEHYFGTKPQAGASYIADRPPA